jgi:hypothetical protein
MRNPGLFLAAGFCSLVACNRSSDPQPDEGSNQTAPNTDLGPAQQSPRPDQGQQPPGQMQPGQAQPGQTQGQGTTGDQAAGWRGDAGRGPATGSGTNPSVPSSRTVTPEGTRGSGQTSDGGSRSP